MKFIIAFIVAVVGSLASAQSHEYSCKFERLLQVGADYQDINDFLFADYPYLVIQSKNRKIQEVSIGAMSYDASEYDFVQSATSAQRILHLIRQPEEIYPAYQALAVVFPNDGSKSAIVISHEEELKGPVAKFNCQ